MAITAERVNAIANEADFYAFLREELSWPLNGDRPATFEFYADELGLTEQAAGKIGSVQQIAPFADGQPWGIFLVKFDNAQGKVYQSALRRVLRGLSETRRDRDASLPAWKAANLLFFCTPNYRDWTVARFEGKTHTRATLSLFGWEHGDTALRTLCEYNLKPLMYPADAADASVWLKQWASAFDVKAVTDRFFDAYRDVFSAFESGLVEQLPAKEARRMFTQTLFNRLMFCWFLQKKGWLYRRSDYLRWQWDFAQAEPGKGAADKRHNYYDEYLQPLFFRLLNTPHGERQEQAQQAELESRLGDIPFLNGGLFDALKDAVPPHSVTVPNAAFAPILQLFAGHNFTVEESTPLEVAVAVDPEMLGKVFEELVTGRHESGSYYTPRPIVAFMCRESLKGYLAHACPDESEEQIAAFVDAREGAKATDLNAPEAVFDALRRVRVCDPACGSGAYLLGMMQELLRLRDSLFAAVKKDYAQVNRRKLEIIQRNLYGADMDAFATNIAMLRLWLSLIVDNDAPLDDVLNGAANVSLPNLRFKIQTNDSLAAQIPDLALFGEEYAHDARELSALYDEYFAPPQDKTDAPHKRAKDRIETDITGVQARIAALLGSQSPPSAVDWCVAFAEVFAPQPPLATIGGAFNFGQELVESPEPGGFDIVLANPPYIRMELFKDAKPVLRQLYANVHAERADLYIYFYARAIQLLKSGGTLAFISPNKWFRAGYGANLRQYIASTCRVVNITDFGELPVFENVATFPMIFVAQKGGHGATTFTQVKNLDDPYPDVLAVTQRSSSNLPPGAINGTEWTLADAMSASILRQMDQTGTPLGNYVNKQIFYGVKTGADKAFILDAKTKDKLLGSCPDAANVIKPLVHGDAVRKWKINDHSRWLLYMYHGVNIENLDTVIAYLQPFRGQLENRATKQKWYELQQPSVRLSEVYAGTKIIYPEIAKEARFTLDTLGMFP